LTIQIDSYPGAGSTVPNTGNNNDGVQVYGGSTYARVTWPDVGADYIVTSTPTISSYEILYGRLYIEDNVTVKFDHGQYISVAGTLNATGTSSILFTRRDITDEWGGLRFQGGSAGGTLQYCTIEYATYSTGYGIYVYNTTTFPTIENCTIQYNDYGIFAHTATSPSLSTANTIQNNNNEGVRFYNCTNPIVSNQTITGHTNTYGAIYMENTGQFTIGDGNTIGGVGQENSWPLTMDILSYPSAASNGNIPTTGNANNGIQVYGGSTGTNSVTWPDVGADYIVTSTPTISSGGTLNINDDVTVKFDNGRYISVAGTLNATGTSGILFTRYDITDEWGGLRFQSGSNGTLQHCTIEYATYSTGYGIYTYNAFPDIQNCTIQNNDYGIFAHTATSPTLSTANTIQNNNNEGVRFYNCTNPVVSNQTIIGHTGAYGAIYMDNIGPFTIGGSNTISGNSWPLTIDILSYPSAATTSGNIPASGNTNNGIQVYDDSTGTASVTWRDVGVDYIVTSTPTVSSGGTLNINDDVTVKFDNGQYIIVYGTLNGTGTGSILLTRFETGEQWSGLYFQSGSSGALQYCTIEHANYGIYTYSGANTISISNCTIQNNNLWCVC